MSEILFIDANKYLELYRAISGSGKKLIKFLVDQRAFILVSDQIVDEVLRNKLGIAHASLAKFLKDVEAINTSVPDHLLGLPQQKDAYVFTAASLAVLGRQDEAKATLARGMANPGLRVDKSSALASWDPRCS
jgi:hypothetical protein